MIWSMKKSVVWIRLSVWIKWRLNYFQVFLINCVKVHTHKKTPHTGTQNYCCKLKYYQKCSYFYLYTTLCESKKNSSMLLCVKWQLYGTMQQFYWVRRIFKLFVCKCSYGSFICSTNGSISKYCSLFSNIFFLYLVFRVCRIPSQVLMDGIPISTFWS